MFNKKQYNNICKTRYNCTKFLKRNDNIPEEVSRQKQLKPAGFHPTFFVQHPSSVKEKNVSVVKIITPGNK